MPGPRRCGASCRLRLAHAIAPRLAAGLACVVVATAPAAAGARITHAQPPGPASDEDVRREEAKARVAKAKELIAAGELEAAAAQYEAVLAIYPRPWVHYNLAVIHHRRMAAQTPDSAEYETSRKSALEQYQAYLDGSPDASDRDSVEETIKKLGGTPPGDAASDWTIERIDPDDVPSPPAFHEDPGATIDPTQPLDVGNPEPDPTQSPGPAVEPAPVPVPGEQAPPSGPRPIPPDQGRAVFRIGPFVPISMSNPSQLAGSDEMVPAPMIGLGLRAGGFLGLRKRINLGGEIALLGQPLGSSGRHILTAGWLGMTVEYAKPLASGKVEVGAGGLVAGTGQTLRYTGDDPLRCAARSSGGISARSGIVLGPRFVLNWLLGAGNHALSVRVSPVLLLHGPGSHGNDDGTNEDDPSMDDPSMDQSPCNQSPTPFETFGLAQGASFAAIVDLGYAFRL